MAGEWLKFEKATPDKPEVFAIAARLDIDPDAVVGKLIRVWSWFDTHTVDGNGAGVTRPLLDRIAGVTGFVAAMESVDWIVVAASGVSLPNFDRHTGETAKGRALGAKRASEHRAKSNAESNDASVTQALPREEKKREEVHTEQKQKQKRRGKRASPDCPADVDPQTWTDWLLLRDAKNAPVSETVIRNARSEAEKAGMPLTAFLAVWCARGSQGLQAEWLKPNERAGPPSQAKPSAAADFRGKTYASTPIDQLPPDLRDAARAAIADD
jgi:hypothetical protein